MGFFQWLISFFKGPDTSEIKELSRGKSKKSTLKCPFCLSLTPQKSIPVSCEHCKKELPPLYAKWHDSLTPTPVQIFGWTQHGKSVFVYALTLMADRLAHLWRSGYACAPITESCRKRLMEVRSFQKTGMMPEPTPLSSDETYVLYLQGMVKWNNRCLMVRDCAGESCDEFDVDLDQVPFLLKAPTTFMVVSIHDLERNPEYSMDMLLINYLSTLVRCGGLDRQRNVVVVLSKADLIPDLPPRIKEYLLSDPIATSLGPAGSPRSKAAQMNRPFGPEEVSYYIDGMQTNSECIAEWLQDSGYGAHFIQHAESHDIRLRFTVVSSLGTPLNSSDNSLSVAWSPRRVLDPLFWALEFEKETLPSTL